ncbi:MAG TPA: type II 3-dehydroquinate dehydratase [Rhizomicrobium sp.]|nr:type II 3-dehydroquinate dehydratase [Rhizomicrobium sp.]
MREILLVNGPNLSRLGQRKPEIYGTDTAADIRARLERLAERRASTLTAFQSNHEGEIIDFIEAHFGALAMIVNPGALMMSGWALRDTLEEFPGYVIEVHISNIYARETFRHRSLLSAVVDGQVCGLGTLGYDLALDYLLNLRR